MKLGQRIASLRKEREYTQEQLAQKLEITRQTISRWESELSAPDYQYIQKLCEVFEMTIEEFLEINPKEKTVEIELIDQVNEIQTKQVKTMKKYLLILIAVLIVGLGLILSKISEMNQRINTLNTMVNVTYPYPVNPSSPSVMSTFDTVIEKINKEEHALELTSTIHLSEFSTDMKVQLQLEQNNQTTIIECTNQGNGVFVSDPYTVSTKQGYNIVGIITTDQSTKKENWYNNWYFEDNEEYQILSTYLKKSSHCIHLDYGTEFHFKSAPTIAKTALIVNFNQIVEQADYPIRIAPENDIDKAYDIEYDDVKLKETIKKYNYTKVLLAVEFPEIEHTEYYMTEFDRSINDITYFTPISKQEYNQFFEK